MVSATVPAPSWITPAKLVLVLSPPVVKTGEPDTPLLTVVPLTPASEPIVSLLPFRSSVAPLTVKDTALPDGMLFAAPTCKVPALMVVAPL